MPPTTPRDELGSVIKAPVEKQDIEEVQRLLSQLRDPLDHSEQDLVLPGLLVALEEGYVDTADLILTRGPRFVKYIPVDEAAVSGAHISIVECLVKHGWDVNGDLDILGHVLGHAINVQGEDNPDFCRWLIDHGAGVNYRQGADLMMPLEIACTMDADPELIRYLLRKGATGRGNKPLCLAARAGHIEALRVLFSEGGDMDINAECDPSDRLYVEKSSGTALHSAAAYGKVDSLNFLLSKGARKDIRNGAGMMPKNSAVFCKNPDCVAALEEGFNPEL